MALAHSRHGARLVRRGAKHSHRAALRRDFGRDERAAEVCEGHRRMGRVRGHCRGRADRPDGVRATHHAAALSKVRADQLLMSRGLAESRTRAQALIMAGAVFSGEKKLAKAGDMLAEDAALEVRGKDHPWVSRGGIKLDHGLTHFGFDVAGAVGLDVGSSTGGFTDVLLSRGAAKVYAVDVGTNQLAWKLRQ